MNGDYQLLEPGVKGPTGATGATGPAGATGATGPAGPAPTGSGNQILATPANGSSGVSALRSMVVADVVTSLAAPNPYFGNGSDGACVLDGTNTFPWASKSGNTYTLTRYPFWTTCVINAGVTLKTVTVISDLAGGTWAVNFGILSARVSITNNGTIDASGKSATGSTAGRTGGGFYWGGYGGKGGNAADLSGGSFVDLLLPSLGGNGGDSGGNGGLGNNSTLQVNAATGGFLAVANAYYGEAIATGQMALQPQINLDASGGTVTPVGPTYFINGGGGGAAGNQTGSAVRGAGGEGGYPLVIRAPSITNGGTITANGGNGGNASTTGGSADGGGPGGGGVVFVYAASYSGNVPSVAAGTPGTGAGAGGSNGGAGTAGTVLYLTNTQ